MKFKVGDKVKCMDAQHTSLDYGKVYEISSAFSGDYDDYVNLISESAGGWSTSRFELVKEEIIMHKFKVGDVVEIVGAQDGDSTKWDYTEGFSNNWVDFMDKCLGKTGVVIEVDKFGVKLDSTGYCYPHQALKFKTEKKDTALSEDKKYRVVGTHEPVRIICTDRNDNKASKLHCVALYTDHRGDEGLLLVSDDGLNCWGDKVIEEVPDIDWSKVKVDALIWIKFSSSCYEPRHFAGFEDDSVCFYEDGRTSHTSKGIISVSKDEVSLNNPNEKA